MLLNWVVLFLIYHNYSIIIIVVVVIVIIIIIILMFLFVFTVVLINYIYIYIPTLSWRPNKSYVCKKGGATGVASTLLYSLQIVSRTNVCQ